MNNEEKILSILETMQRDISGLKSGQAKLESGQAKLESGQAKLESGQALLESKVDGIAARQAEMTKTLNAVFEHTMQLTERLTATEMNVRELRAAK